MSRAKALEQIERIVWDESLTDEQVIAGVQRTVEEALSGLERCACRTTADLDLPVLHLLHTVMDYGPLTADAARVAYNSECKYDEFDPLPQRTTRSIAAGLAALRGKRLVRSLHHSETPEWEITDEGRSMAESFVGTVYA